MRVLEICIGVTWVVFWECSKPLCMYTGGPPQLGQGVMSTPRQTKFHLVEYCVGKWVGNLSIRTHVASHS